MRDYSTELRGNDRFLQVRSDPDKIMTVCLDYGPGHVDVHDLVHSRTGQVWTLTKSSYRKLRLTQAQITDMLTRAGLVPQPPFNLEGFMYFVAQKPA